jgi:hypothetical protein
VIDIEGTLAHGGAERLDFLRYCVMSINMDPVFIFLAGEYRLRPTHLGAFALHDLFCAIDAPARLAAYELLAPRELGVSAEIARLRQNREAMQQPAEDSETPARTVPAGPGRMLFDAIVQGLRADSGGRLEAIRTRYDPQRTPEENLPGGKLSGAQRQFVNRVWLPVVRPRLTAAGFWQIGTIG